MARQEGRVGKDDPLLTHTCTDFYMGGMKEDRAESKIGEWYRDGFGPDRVSPTQPGINWVWMLSVCVCVSEKEKEREVER